MQIASLTGVQIVKCGAKQESGKKYVGREREREREREEGSFLRSNPLPHPLALFCSLLFARQSPPSERLEKVILQITLGL